MTNISVKPVGLDLESACVGLGLESACVGLSGKSLALDYLDKLEVSFTALHCLFATLSCP